MIMTTRKYKKMLMSCGIDRNMAEFERQTIAKFRGYSLDNYATKCMNNYKELASVLKENIGGSLSGRRKLLAKCIRDAEKGMV